MALAALLLVATLGGLGLAWVERERTAEVLEASDQLTAVGADLRQLHRRPGERDDRRRCGAQPSSNARQKRVRQPD